MHKWWEYTGRPDPGEEEVVNSLKRLVTSGSVIKLQFTFLVRFLQRKWINYQKKHNENFLIELN